MNLAKLFEMQKVLIDKIIKRNNLEEQDLLPNLFLSLMTELGELANEERSWKHWSKDRKPRTKVVRVPTMMEEDKEYYNPLLEEYADCLSFILEIGLELEDEFYWDRDAVIKEIIDVKNHELVEFKQPSVTNLFNACFYYAANDPNEYYSYLFAYFLILGERLSFTWEQIEQAYKEKNAVNHKRQESGY